MPDQRPDPPATRRLTADETRAVAAAFLGGAESTRNPFSNSGRVVWRGDAWHCKHGRRPLAAEAAALARAMALAGDAAVGVVPLAGYDAANNVLITAHVTGSSLFNVLWNGTSPWRLRALPPDGVTERMAAVGGWLRRLHEMMRPACEAVAADELCRRLLATIDDRLRTVRRHDRRVAETGVSLSLLDRLADEAARLSADPAWHDEPITAIHADLTPGNMLQETSGRLTVLDFGYTRPGFALEDVARLWCSLWEIAACGRTRARRLRPGMAALLRGYGLGEDAVDTAPFRLLRIWNAVTRLNEAVSTRSGYHAATARLHRRLMRRHVDWLTREFAADNLVRRAACRKDRPQPPRPAAAAVGLSPAPVGSPP